MHIRSGRLSTRNSQRLGAKNVNIKITNSMPKHRYIDHVFSFVGVAGSAVVERFDSISRFDTCGREPRAKSRIISPKDRCPTSWVPPNICNQFLNAVQGPAQSGPQSLLVRKRTAFGYSVKMSFAEKHPGGGPVRTPTFRRARSKPAPCIRRSARSGPGSALSVEWRRSPNWAP